MPTCVVIGNGPSLSKVPYGFLDKYDTFGANRLYTSYIPTFYVAVNPLVLDQYLNDIRNIEGAEKFIKSGYADKVPGSTPLHSSTVPVFHRDPLKSVYEGYTVTFVSLQLAFYFGYDTVLLVGVDHSYKFDGLPNQELVMKGDDPNHFSPDYFAKGTHWNAPDLRQSERSYKMAKRVFDHDGRRILNLGPDSKLEVFAKDDLGKW